MQVTKLGLYVLHYKNINKMNNLIPVNEPSLNGNEEKNMYLNVLNLDGFPLKVLSLRNLNKKCRLILKGNIA